MIVCTGCGNANASQSEFCGSCGAYLEWHGEKVGADPAPAPEPPPVVVVPAERPKFLDRVRYAVGLDDELPGQHGPHVASPHVVSPPVGGGGYPPAAEPSPAGPSTTVPHPPGPPTFPPGPPTFPPGPPTFPPGPPTLPPGPSTLPPGPSTFPPGPPTAPFGFAPTPLPPTPLAPTPLAPTPPGPPPGLGGGNGGGIGLDRPAPPEAPISPPVGSPLSPAAPTYPIGQAPVGRAPVSPAPEAPFIGPRPPEKEYERPPAQRPDPIDLGPADLYCGSCGVGNTGDRRFCRKCGASLADALRPAKLPWWRRIFSRDRHYDSEPRYAKNSLPAGERPENWVKLSDSVPIEEKKPKRRWRLPKRFPLSRFALPLVALSVVGMGLGPMRAKATEVAFDLYHGAKRKFSPEYVHVTPERAGATDAVANHPASAAIDRNTNSYWSEGRPGSGAGSVITVVFDRPTALVKVGFDNGAAGKEFPFQPRLRDVEVTYHDGDRVISKKRFTLADKPEFQTVTLLGKDVGSASVKIISVYEGQRGSAASLAELAFVTVQ